MSVKMTHSDTAFTVAVESAGAGHISGRITGYLLPEPLCFSDLGQLVLALDALFDELNFPQAFQRARRFGPGTETPATGSSLPPAKTSAKPVETFVLNVLTRRSSSWQGFVIWQDDSRAAFPSTLALLRLISSHFGI